MISTKVQRSIQPEPKLSSLDKKILSLLSEQYALKNIAKNLNKDHSTISYHLNKLIKLGIIKPNKRGYYDFTNKGFSLVENPNMVEDDKQLITSRSHFIQIKSKVVFNTPDYIEQAIKQGWRTFKMTGWVGLRKKINEVEVRITPDNIIYIFDELVFPTSELAMNEAIRIVKLLEKEVILKEFPRLKLADPEKLSHQIVSQHHALQGDPFAILMKQNKLSYKDERINYDHSKKIGEFETVHPQLAESDWMRRIHFDKMLINKEFNPEEVANLPNQIEKIYNTLEKLAGIQETQTNQLETFRLAMQEHLALISGLQEVTKAMKENKEILDEEISALRQEKREYNFVKPVKLVHKRFKTKRYDGSVIQSDLDAWVNKSFIPQV